MAKRQAKKEKNLDLRVYEALGNNSLWKGPRATNGAGFPEVRAFEIAEYLKVDVESVIESLGRSAARGMAISDGGTQNDPRPRWTYLPR